MRDPESYVEQEGDERDEAWHDGEPDWPEVDLSDVAPEDRSSTERRP